MRPVLTLAHSPDPDDAFMWWPITGKVDAGEVIPGGEGALPRVVAPPAIDTGRFEYRALPADIEALNRRAAARGDLDITALSFRAWAEVQDRYVLTACGSSFGDGFGPKVVARVDQRGDAVTIGCDACLRNPKARIAIPGRRTTAFLVLGMALGEKAMADSSRFVEMPFDRVIPAVASRQVEAGLVIHEGQVLFERAGLGQVLDLGAWWKHKTGLPLPLGANAIRRDVESRFGAGSLGEIARTLRASIGHALAHRRESLEYTLPFALGNTLRAGGAPAGTGPAPQLDEVDRYVRMYVNAWTLDMGQAGRDAVGRLLGDGAALGLCPDAGQIQVVG